MTVARPGRRRERCRSSCARHPLRPRSPFGEKVAVVCPAAVPVVAPVTSKWIKLGLYAPVETATGAVLLCDPSNVEKREAALTASPLRVHDDVASLKKDVMAVVLGDLTGEPQGLMLERVCVELWGTR